MRRSRTECTVRMAHVLHDRGLLRGQQAHRPIDLARAERVGGAVLRPPTRIRVRSVNRPYAVHATDSRSTRTVVVSASSRFRYTRKGPTGSTICSRNPSPRAADRVIDAPIAPICLPINGAPTEGSTATSFPRKPSPPPAAPPRSPRRKDPCRARLTTPEVIADKPTFTANNSALACRWLEAGTTAS